MITQTIVVFSQNLSDELQGFLFRSLWCHVTMRMIASNSCCTRSVHCIDWGQLEKFEFLITVEIEVAKWGKQLHLRNKKCPPLYISSVVHFFVSIMALKSFITISVIVVFAFSSYLFLKETFKSQLIQGWHFCWKKACISAPSPLPLPLPIWPSRLNKPNSYSVRRDVRCDNNTEQATILAVIV